MKALNTVSISSILILVLLTGPAVSSWAQNSNSPINITAHTSKPDVTVGEHVVYKIKVRHIPDITVQPPNPGEDVFAGFELMDFGHDGPKEVNGQQEEVFWFKLRGDRVGSYSIQNIKIPFVTKGPSGKSIPGEAKAPPHILQVRSVLYLDGQPEDIRDIKSIIGAGIDLRKVLWSALAAVLFLALVMGIITWWRRIRKKSSLLPVEEKISPNELALRELQHLIDRGWVEEGRFREFAFELSEIFRRYLGSRYDIPALDWTTQEILSHLVSTTESTDQALEEIEIILSETDQMKFAKAEPDLGDLRNQVKMMKRLIQHIPEPAPDPTPEPSPA